MGLLREKISSANATANSVYRGFTQTLSFSNKAFLALKIKSVSLL